MKEELILTYELNGKNEQESFQKTVDLSEMGVEESPLQQLGVFVDYLNRVHGVEDEQISMLFQTVLGLRGAGENKEGEDNKEPAVGFQIDD